MTPRARHRTRDGRGPAPLLLLVVLAACARSPALGPDGCPKDLVAAQGSACASEGKACGTNPSGFTHFIMCSGGKWGEFEAPPPPPPTPSTSTAPSASVAGVAPGPYDTSCTYDDDCVPAPGCCPAPCTSLVINRREVDRVRADLQTSCPKDVQCPSAGGCVTHAYLCVRGACAKVNQGDADWRPESARTRAPK